MKVSELCTLIEESKIDKLIFQKQEETEMIDVKFSLLVPSSIIGNFTIVLDMNPDSEVEQITIEKLLTALKNEEKDSSIILTYIQHNGFNGLEKDYFIYNEIDTIISVTKNDKLLFIFNKNIEYNNYKRM